MLPYAPLHHLLFATGAPEVLVMTSANRSSEPIAYRDEDARQRLSGIADAFLAGERPIARRVDDSVARAGVFGPMILRRSRGYSPGAVTMLPGTRPVLAVGADLKNSITLSVGGQAFVSQHIGDLDHYESFAAFRDTIRDFVAMYSINWDDLLIVHDLHPEYVSTLHALELPAGARRAVQHHRAHVASVLAERQAWERRAVGVSFDGTGYGDDGSIWGGEFFTGSPPIRLVPNTAAVKIVANRRVGARTVPLKLLGEALRIAAFNRHSAAGASAECALSVQDPRRVEVASTLQE
jgi:hydrogenase maturation protein HypF